MRLPRLNDRALSKRERDRSRFPHLEPIGLRPPLHELIAHCTREKEMIQPHPLV
jgi:hypothetical protein